MDAGRYLQDVAIPPPFLVGRGRYWVKFGHASFYAARPSLTHHVNSPPPITALRKDHSITERRATAMSASNVPTQRVADAGRDGDHARRFVRGQSPFDPHYVLS
jgi:hypothetical protein